MAQHHPAQVNAKALEDLQLLQAARAQRCVGADGCPRFCMGAGRRTEHLGLRLGDVLRGADLADDGRPDTGAFHALGQFLHHDVTQLLFGQRIALRREKGLLVVARRVGDLHPRLCSHFLHIGHVPAHPAVGLVDDADHTVFRQPPVFCRGRVKIIHLQSMFFFGPDRSIVYARAHTESFQAVSKGFASCIVS